MISAGMLQANESFYQKQSQKLLQKIVEVTGEAIDSVNKFDIQTNSDKLCISTIANNFARELDYILNDLQRITIDNHKRGDDNKNLKEAVLGFSTFVYSIQLAFGNDFNTLKMKIIDVLQNLESKFNPLLEIVQEHSAYSSKREITSNLDYLYIAIEKLKLRTQWEHLNQEELQNAIAHVLDYKLLAIENSKDKEDLAEHYRRTAHEAIEGILHVLGEMDIDLNHFDDKIQGEAFSLSAKIADSIFDLDKAVRKNYKMSELSMYAKLTTKTIVPTTMEVLRILQDKNLQDPNGNIKNFILNIVINALGCSIRFARDWERILEN